MRAHGHATVWGAHVSVSRSREGLGWVQRLRQWIKSYKLEHKRVALEQLHRCWDPQCEKVVPQIVESALDYEARQSRSVLPLALYSGMV